MESALDYSLHTKFCNLVSNFKLGNIENIIKQMLENIEKYEGVYYIGEMNKTDSIL